MAKNKAKERPTSKKWERYEIKGDAIERKNKICPRCGPCVFLAQHKDRIACGKCGYAEIVKK